MEKVKILVVEDEIIIADSICNALNELGYHALEPAINFTEAIESIESERPDIAILDIHLSGKKINPFAVVEFHAIKQCVKIDDLQKIKEHMKIIAKNFIVDGCLVTDDQPNAAQLWESLKIMAESDAYRQHLRQTVRSCVALVL